MNYVILNGKRSTTIIGLLIQSLPPISKPLMRSQVEEIDGRDGDIVTKLGYSAYDKEFRIGLYGNYDVDEVISFFDSEGTVTFSNEPTKVYRYQMLDQIDFERLLRFKEATVRFHVQPFKHSLQDKPLSFPRAEMMSIPSYSVTKSGVTMNGSGRTITLSGSGTTEIYVPITALNLTSGGYGFNVTASGSNADNVRVRLIHGTPTDANTFGGQALAPVIGSLVSVNQVVSSGSFNYIHLSVTGSVSCTLTLSFEKTDFDIINTGNIFSLPKITIYGSGAINLYVNDTQVFAITQNVNFITIDAEEMNAFHGSTLLNRYVVGDYENFKLPVGRSTIRLSGNVTNVTIDNYSRWR